MSKPTINMFSSAEKVKGQGVGSAYAEMLALVREGLSDEFDIVIGQRIQAEITHYHTIDPQFAFWRGRRTRKGKSLGSVHMLPETVENSLRLPRLAKKIFYWYMIRFYKKMDYLITVNPYFIGELARYGIPREKTTYVPNYVSSEKFHPLSAERRAEIREKYGVPRDTFAVLSAGQLQTRKGIFDILKIAERMPDVVFVWAGGFSFGAITEGYKELSKVVENPPHNVKFLGIIDRADMNDVYNMADVMFLASFEELFPMTILEAMCVNVPVLLRDLDIYPDILFDFYLKADSVDGFIDEIARLRDDSDYYGNAREMSKKGNRFYGKENVTELWRKLYQKIMDHE